VSLASTVGAPYAGCGEKANTNASPFIGSFGAGADRPQPGLENQQKLLSIHTVVN
jgi:hypothetical protein